MNNFKNLDQCSAFKALQLGHKVNIKKELTAGRVNQYQMKIGGELYYNYSAKAVDDRLLEFMVSLAGEMGLLKQYRAVVNGEIMNMGENRRVLHHLTRGELGNTVIEEGKNLRHFYEEQRIKIASFTDDIEKGLIRGSTGKHFTTIVQIGIGGSDLGPRAIYLALEHAYPKKMEAKFISNVDPDDANSVLSEVDLETTLFILVTKSGTTGETLANLNFVLEKGRASNIARYDPYQHMVVVTSETSALAQSTAFLNCFYIDDHIGGRFSSCSAVGGVLLSLAFGHQCFKEFLDGAHEADRLALNENILENGAMLDALISIYECNVLGYNATAILPYSQALNRFPAHLQQVEMESNGKTTNRMGQKVDYATGPIIFGESGTNGQHSFYQLLHQGSQIIPLEFIGFKEAQMVGDTIYNDSTSQQKLNANLAAQITAFVMGKRSDNPNKNFDGLRPVSLIYGERLTAASMGALLAHYENKVMFQGFLWNLNSFDQEGVQLGKLLAGELLKGEGDELLKAFAHLLRL